MFWPRRYLVVARVRGRGWHQHAEQRKFRTHAGAVLFALQAIRQNDRWIEWHPMPRHGKVRDPASQRWLAASKLPPWLGD